MPSTNARKIIAPIEAFLQRKLTAHEHVLCEEMVYNFFPKPIVIYVQGLVKKRAPKTFTSVYYPISGGLIRGAARRLEYQHFDLTIDQLFSKMHTFLGDELNDAGVEAILWLAWYASKSEIAEALSYVKQRQIKSPAYMKAMILSKRERAHKDRPGVPMSSIITKEKPVRAVDIGKSKKDWKKKSELAKVELNARHHSTTQGKGTAS